MSNYDFKSLSPIDFELLVRDLLQADSGERFENFKLGADGGIDLRAYLQQRYQWIVQCKHYVGTGYKKLLSDLETREVQKVAIIKPRRYTIATSVSMTPKQVDSIRELFLPYCQDITVLSQEGINNLLGAHPNVEQKHFKLWLTSKALLDRLLKSAIVNFTQYDLELMQEKLKLYVRTDAFDRALSILESEHVCIISGIPGIGKTTLAEILMIHYVDKGFPAVRITEDIGEAYSVDLPGVGGVYYYDDFLGQTSLLDKLNKNEDDRLLKFVEHVKRKSNKRFILTTREYILNQARSVHEKLARADLDLYKFLLNIEHYTRRHRAEILYNHLYFSDLPKEHRRSLATSEDLLKIVDHKNYSPRVIDRLTKAVSIKNVNPAGYAEVFRRALDNPEYIWRHAFENQISTEGQSVLIALFGMKSSTGLSELAAASSAYMVGRPNDHVSVAIGASFKRAMKELDGNMLTTRLHDSHSNQVIVASFHNPSIRDFLSIYIGNNHDVLRRLLTTAQYFEVCETVWQLSRAEPANHLDDQTLADFWHAVDRTIDSGSAVYKGTGGDGESSYPCLVSFEERLAQVLKMSTTLKFAGSNEIIERLLNKFLERLRLGYPVCSEAFEVMVSAVGIQVSSNAIMPTLVATLAEYFATSADTGWDFECALEFDSVFPRAFSDEQIERLKALVSNYAHRLAFGSVHFYPAYDALPRELESLEKVAEVLCLHIDGDLDNIRGDVRALDDEMERRADEYRHGFPSASASDISSDEIYCMFDTFR